MLATRDSAGRIWRKALRRELHILPLAEELTSKYAPIEFVAPRNPMFARIVRGRQALCSNLTVAGFEAAAASRFEPGEISRNRRT
jgi:hypothetical protein